MLSMILIQILIFRIKIGKTTLIKRLLKDKMPDNVSTDGVEINRMEEVQGSSFLGRETTKIEIEILDFGGQTIYHATHQFFICEKAVYLLVFDMKRQDYKSRILYWCNTISTLLKCLPLPSVFLVGTHLDKVSSKELKAVNEEISSLMKKYKNIKYFFPTSSKTKKGIKKLYTAITEHIKESKLASSLLPYSTTKFMNFLQKRSGERELPILSMNKFNTIGMISGMKSEEIYELTKFLTSYGSVLNWPRDLSLKNIVIIDPLWLSKQMTSVLSYKVKWVKGIASRHAILNMMPSDTKRKRGEDILNILNKFEVIFYNPETPSNILIPSLFPSSLDSKHKQKLEHIFESRRASLYFGRKFLSSFYPQGFFSRLLVRFNCVMASGNKIEQWGTGISVENPAVTAISLITDEVDESGNGVVRIRVREILSLVNGEEKKSQSDAKDLLLSVLEVVDSLVVGLYSNLEIEKIMECPKCRNDSWKYPKVVAAFVEGLSEMECFNCHKKSEIKEIAPDIAFEQLTRIEEVTIHQVCGRGGFGTVYKGEMMLEGAQVFVAVKELNNKASRGEVKQQKFVEFSREIYLMSKLAHPNLVRLYGVMTSPLRMVLEFCFLPDLHKILSDKSSFPEQVLSRKLRARIALDISEGMKFLISNKPPILHRDLRSPNVFMMSLDESAPCVCKVGDFGMATILDFKLKEALSTWQWMAPEVLNNEGYGETSDVFSFGIVVCEVLRRDEPYTQFTEFLETVSEWVEFTESGAQTLVKGKKELWKNYGRDCIRAIIEKDLRPTVPQECEQEWKLLVAHCFDKAPFKRWTFHEISHFLEEFFSLIK